MTRDWKSNAEEFRDHDQGEGWMFPLLVACSVERAATKASGKVSGEEFARTAGTSAARILHLLDGWNEYAERGLVPQSSTLRPADVRKVPLPEEPFKAPPVRGGRQYGNVTEAIRTIEKRGAEEVVARMSEDQRAAVVEAVAGYAPAVVAETATRVAPIQVREAQERDADRRLFDLGARAVTGGGAMPVPGANPPSPNPAVDQESARRVTLQRAEALVQQAGKLVRELGDLREDEEDRVRRIALDFLAALDRKEVAR